MGMFAPAALGVLMFAGCGGDSDSLEMAPSTTGDRSC